MIDDLLPLAAHVNVNERTPVSLRLSLSDSNHIESMKCPSLMGVTNLLTQFTMPEISKLGGIVIGESPERIAKRPLAFQIQKAIYVNTESRRVRWSAPSAYTRERVHIAHMLSDSSPLRRISVMSV